MNSRFESSQAADFVAKFENMLDDISETVRTTTQWDDIPDAVLNVVSTKKDELRAFEVERLKKEVRND